MYIGFKHFWKKSTSEEWNATLGKENISNLSQELLSTANKANDASDDGISIIQANKSRLILLGGIIILW